MSGHALLSGLAGIERVAALRGDNGVTIVKLYTQGVQPGKQSRPHMACLKWVNWGLLLGAEDEGVGTQEATHWRRIHQKQRGTPRETIVVLWKGTRHQSAEQPEQGVHPKMTQHHEDAFTIAGQHTCRDNC